MDAAMKPPWMGLRRPQQGYLDSIVRDAGKSVT